MSTAPKIHNLKDKIVALERRLSFLQDKIDRAYFSNVAAQYTRQEASALKAALECMQYVKDTQP